MTKTPNQVEPIKLIPDDVWRRPEQFGVHQLLVVYDIGTDGWVLLSKDQQVLITDPVICLLIRKLLRDGV